VAVDLHHEYAHMLDTDNSNAALGIAGHVSNDNTVHNSVDKKRQCFDCLAVWRTSSSLLQCRASRGSILRSHPMYAACGSVQ
jgi:hypothetical protein